MIIGPVTLRGGAGANIVFAGAGNQNIVLGEDDDELYGGAGDDVVGSEGGDDPLFGNSGNDTMFGGEGADFIHGGKDTDTITYEGNTEDYIVEQHHSIITVTLKSDPTDVDTLVNVETLQFADGDQTLSYNHSLTQIATLYNQMFDRQADLNGFQHWAGRFVENSFQEIGMGFLESDEARSIYNVDVSQVNNETAVDYLYHALMGRDADAEGKAHWLDRMDNGDALQVVAECFISSEEFDLYGVAETNWEFFI